MQNATAVSFGPYTFHRQQRLVSKAGWPVPLGGRALDILAVLLEAPGHFISKATLIERVWPNSVVEDSNLRVHIAALRRALDGQRWILNHPQRGYCFFAAPAQDALPTLLPQHNLAARLSPVWGRDELVGVLARRLAAQRLLTLTGVAGIGKSTLALALAERVLPRYRDGVWWVDMAAVQAPSELLGNLTRVLPLHSAPASLTELGRRLASRQLLLVLDGADLLLGACRQLLRALREMAPGISVLITSREALLAPGEWMVRVPRLAGPSPSAHVEQAMGCPAVQLFVARARANQQGFSLRPQDLAPLRDLCRRLDGLPLALELAAAQVDALGIGGVQVQVRTGLQVLARGRRTAVARHRSLTAALDWSYERLSLPECWLFLQLSLFKIAVTLPTLSDLVAGTELEHADLSYLLARLVNVSLLSVEPGLGPPRYRLLNCVRSYALGQLRDPRQVERLQQGYAPCLGAFSGRPLVLQLVEQAAHAQ
ncbi:transcriptional regulator [Pseudomonas sp. GL93]|uniref:winged helix-turn-helix domain-containing protein n=1 Tax=Pseudomonas sp. GL93 TaxID=2014741 RepID=UPI000E31BE16|nr:winged helix-turn-helix domain-containing protein [Pseudomonas sp. GL93]RFD31199.1 transcriptional regulator [Pseudomonas sp. GL93]